MKKKKHERDIWDFFFSVAKEESRKHEKSASQMREKFIWLENKIKGKEQIPDDKEGERRDEEISFKVP